MKSGKRMVILGFGAMGSALARGWLGKKLVRPVDLRVVDPDPGKAALAKRGFRLTAVPAHEALPGAQVVLLAVKPQQMKDLLAASGPLFPKGALVVSIAAGVSTAGIERLLPQGCPVVRVMPNTPAQAGAGMSAVAGGARAKRSHVRSVLKLFEAVGVAVEVREEWMDLVTGMSGSGPAYFYLLIESLAKAGVEGGMSPALALTMAAQTALGAARMAVETGKSPEELRAEVTSPGGTTQAGLGVLSERGFPDAVRQAVRAAAARSTEIRRTYE